MDRARFGGGQGGLEVGLGDPFPASCAEARQSDFQRAAPRRGLAPAPPAVEKLGWRQDVRLQQGAPAPAAARSQLQPCCGVEAGRMASGRQGCRSSRLGVDRADRCLGAPWVPGRRHPLPTFLGAGSRGRNSVSRDPSRAVAGVPDSTTRRGGGSAGRPPCVPSVRGGRGSLRASMSSGSTSVGGRASVGSGRGGGTGAARRSSPQSRARGGSRRAGGAVGPLQRGGG